MYPWPVLLCMESAETAEGEAGKGCGAVFEVIIHSAAEFEFFLRY